MNTCVIEKIIQNKFWDPLISSDEEEPVRPIDWDSVFYKTSNVSKGLYYAFTTSY